MPRRATRILPNGRWTETSASATVTLAFDDRYRRRIQLTDDAGVPFLLDLARPAVLADGDGLLLDDGGIIAVRAAAEDLAEVAAEIPGALVRIAWHLGNRHLPVQLLPDAIRLRWDPVIVDMLHGLGARVARIQAPFDPESGAYAGGGHAPSHAHSHD